MDLKPLQYGRVFMDRLPHGADLLAALTEFCTRNGITLGEVHAIGAVSRGRFGFYDQSVREYRFLELNKPLEIVSLLGNVSTRDGKPFIHAHIALMDEDGSVYGGHLAEGNIIFACECTVKEFSAPDSGVYNRAPDEQTGLFLWPR